MIEKEAQSFAKKLEEKILVSVVTFAATTLVTTAVGTVFPPAAPFVAVLAGPAIGVVTEKIVEDIYHKKNAPQPAYPHIVKKDNDKSLEKSKVQNHEQTAHKEEHKEHKDLGKYTHQIIDHEQHPQNSHEDVHG